LCSTPKILTTYPCGIGHSSTHSLPSPGLLAASIMLEAAVNHDGFDGLFSGYSGAYVPEILSALRQIGAPYTHALVERAIAVAYPDGYPRSEEHTSELQSLA